LFSVSGACQGIDIRLESDTLPFGAVVQKSSTTRKIQLQNAGDIGAKFAWKTASFFPDFSISPSEGYISPGTEIPLEITFNPTEVNADIRYDALPCTIEGIADLHITLTGTCIPQPSQVDAIKFSTPVRGSETKSIALMNKTNYPWKITPIIENPYFKGADLFELEPGQTKSYEVTFSPLETVGLGDSGRHEGSVFFPLADGTGLLYKLYGYADKPSPVATISREIASKTQHTEILSVYNWLKRPQRFRVAMDLVKPDYVTLKGADFIDVPPLMSKDYKLSFFSHREGSVAAKIMFRNEQSQEFTFWNINFKSTPPGILSTLEMNTSVRQACIKEVMIHNPLSTAAVFGSACPSADVTVPHTFTIAPK
jgi:hypothetical protein